MIKKLKRIIYLILKIIFHIVTVILAKDNNENVDSIKLINMLKRLWFEICLLILGAILINWYPIIYYFAFLRLNVIGWIIYTYRQ